MKKFLPILALGAAAYVWFSRKPAPAAAAKTAPPVSASNPGTGNDPNVLSTLYKAFTAQKTPNNTQPQISQEISAGASAITALGGLYKTFTGPSTSSPAQPATAAPATPALTSDASFAGYDYNGDINNDGLDLQPYSDPIVEESLS